MLLNLVPLISFNVINDDGERKEIKIDCTNFYDAWFLDNPGQILILFITDKTITLLKKTTFMNIEELKEEPLLEIIWAYKCSQIHEIKLFEGYIINLKVEDTQQYIRVLRNEGNSSVEDPTKA